MATPFWLLLLILIFTLTSSYTIIPATGSWDDDWVYNANGDVNGDAWYDASGGSGSDLDATSGTLPDGTDIHGWFRMTNTEAIDMISRAFKCPFYSTVNIEFHAYFCIDGSAGDPTTIYYRRTAIDQYFPARLTDYQYGRDKPDYARSTVSGGNGFCGSSVERAVITDTFEMLTSKSFTLSFDKRIRNGNTGNDRQIAGFKVVSITCTQIPTPSPTEMPSSATAIPSETPTKHPSASPSNDPSRAPTNQPSRSPITAAPSKAPTTPIPTRAPSKDPSVSPTKGPTRKPTDNPTEKPTERPTPKPSAAPTRQRDLGQQFSDAFGGSTNPDCTEGESWVECNTVVFIILLCIVIGCCCYWILGTVWFKRRQSNRPDPSRLVKADSQGDGVEMGTAHVTSDKWKSAWELENEAAQGGGDAGGGDW